MAGQRHRGGAVPPIPAQIFRYRRGKEGIELLVPLPHLNHQPVEQEPSSFFRAVVLTVSGSIECRPRSKLSCGRLVNPCALSARRQRTAAGFWRNQPTGLWSATGIAIRPVLQVRPGPKPTTPRAAISIIILKAGSIRPS